MSYCRFAWDGSDVYVYESAQGIECCGCRFDEHVTVQAPEEMIAHLARHRRSGHFVPEHAITGLWADIPGAQRPPDGEPALMTHGRLLGMQARLAAAIKVASDRVDEEAREEARTADAVDPQADSTGTPSTRV